MQIRIKTIVLAVSIFVILQFCFSCKNSNENIIEKKINPKLFYNDVVQFEFEFPDTVIINKSYNGKIKYKGILDTITTIFDFENKKKSRYIMYSFTKTKLINYDDEHLSKIALDTIGALNNKTILLSDMKFTELGIIYIDGIINDSAFLGLDQKDEDGDYLTRVIKNEVRATSKVVVIENPK